MSLERMLDERVNLKVRVNLIENQESTSSGMLEAVKAQLTELEQLIGVTRKMGS